MPKYNPETCKDKYKKVILKILNPDVMGAFLWVHFCYVPRDLWEDFKRLTGCANWEIAAWLRKWAKEDFDVDLKMTTKKDIDFLKSAIEVLYQDRYFELYSPTLGGINVPLSSVTRNWTATKMKMECVKYEQQSK